MRQNGGGAAVPPSGRTGEMGGQDTLPLVQRSSRVLIVFMAGQSATAVEPSHGAAALLEASNRGLRLLPVPVDGQCTHRRIRIYEVMIL
jgi:hypothetical protein